jgi:hypothetical protein
MTIAEQNPVRSDHDSPGVRTLLSFCRALQTVVGDQPFFLSARTAGGLVGVHHATAWRWLFMLEREGWIRTVEKGGTEAQPRRATRFRFLGKPAEAEGQDRGPSGAAT